MMRGRRRRFVVPLSQPIPCHLIAFPCGIPRAQTSQSSLRRSIIRHMYVLLDLSISMNDKDMRPTR